MIAGAQFPGSEIDAETNAMKFVAVKRPFDFRNTQRERRHKCKLLFYLVTCQFDQGLCRRRKEKFRVQLQAAS
jgi:hypothetical protein